MTTLNATLSNVDILRMAARQTVSDISVRFPRRVLSQADEKASNWHEGHPDLYDGMMLTSEGAFRVLFHTPSETEILAFAKNPHWLRGVYDQKGQIRPINRTLSGIYAVAAFTTIGTHKVNCITHDVSSVINRGVNWEPHIDSFRQKMRTLSQSHLSLYAASPNSCNKSSPIGILGNSAQGYAFWEENKKVSARFRLINDKNIKGHDGYTQISHENSTFAKLTSTSQKLGDFSSLPDMGRALVMHWAKEASNEWNGVTDASLLQTLKQPLRMGKKTAQSTAEWLREEGWKAFTASTVIALVGNFVLGPAALFAALQAIEHRAADEMLVKTYDKLAEGRLKKLRPENDTDLPADFDVRDHFLIRSRENFVRLTPELSDIFANDIVFLKGTESRIADDSGVTYIGFQETYPYEWILNYPNQGLNNFSCLPDCNSICYHGLNGYVGLHVYDGTYITVYARMRDETNIQENLKIPRFVRDQLNQHDKILKISYQLNDTCDIVIADGRIRIKTEHISIDEMITEVSKRFEKTIQNSEDRETSLDYIRASFGPDKIPSLIPLGFPTFRAAAPTLG